MEINDRRMLLLNPRAGEYRIHTLNKIPLISIVDDDRSCRMALGSLVRSLGYQPCLFGCAEDFLASAEIGKTDCLISDVQMPGMDGLDLQRRLVSDGRSIPIIFITAYPKESIRKRAEAAGAIFFLSKPYSGQVIINCIEQIVTEG